MSATCSRTRTTSCSPGRSPRSWRSGPAISASIPTRSIDALPMLLPRSGSPTPRRAPVSSRLSDPQLVGIALGRRHAAVDLRARRADDRPGSPDVGCLQHGPAGRARHRRDDRLRDARHGARGGPRGPARRAARRPSRADGTARAVFADTATMAATRLRPPQITRLSMALPGLAGRPPALGDHRARRRRAGKRPRRPRTTRVCPARTVDHDVRGRRGCTGEPARQAHLAPGGDRLRAGHVRPGPAAGRRRARVRRLRRHRDRRRGRARRPDLRAGRGVDAGHPDAGARRVWGDLHRDRRGRSAEPLWSRHAARPVARRTHPGRRDRRARRPRDHPSVRPVRRARPPPRPVPFQLHAVDDAAARADPPARGLDRARRPTVARDAEQRLRAILPSFVPVFAGAFERVQQLSISLESRAFGSTPGRRHTGGSGSVRATRCSCWPVLG